MTEDQCVLRRTSALALLAAAAVVSASAQDTSRKAEPLMIQEQGSFAIGGTVMTRPGTYDATNRSPAGQTLHGDHAYVFYQVPARARRLPLVLWHGMGQFSKTWETTPDGREGFQNIFLRRRFAVYVIDQPRRGRAGRSTLPVTITPTPDEQDWFGTFRLGIWPDLFPGVQFSRDPEALNQYFRQITPDTGPARSRSELRCGHRAVQEDRAGDSRDSFTLRGHGLACRNEEFERPSHRLLRTRERFHLPGRRSAIPDAERRR